MARAGDVVENPAGRMRLRFLRTAADTNGELVEMEATYGPGSVEPLEHFHPRQEEHQFRGEFRPTSPPPVVQAVVIPALAILARLLGQRP